jgi:uncharacterized repeat protein (TIGR02543 family)
MKKFLALALVFVLLSGAFPVFAAQPPSQNFMGKISPELIEAMSEASANDKLRVYLWLESIDQAAVEDEVEMVTGFTDASFEIDHEEFNALADMMTNADDEEIDEYFRRTRRERERTARDVDRYIVERRRIARREYNALHDRFRRNHLRGIEIEFESQLTPMVVIHATRADILRIARADSVQLLGLYEDIEYEDAQSWVVDDMIISKQGTMANHTRNVMGLRGRGIVIGQFETERVPLDAPELIHADISHIPLPHAMTGPHARDVAIVMVGTTGVVPEARIISGIGMQPLGWEVAVLPPHNVHLINQSAATIPVAGGTQYCSFARWLDYMVANHHVMFVMSTGNQSSTTTFYNTGRPGTAFNILAVGSLDHRNTAATADDRFAPFTNFGTSFGLIKPDVIAPGGGGTSFASPHVAGIIAQMLEAEPALRTQSHLVKARILASTDRKVLGANGLPDPNEPMGQVTPRQGAGVVNARNAVTFGGYTGTLAANANHYEITIPVQGGVDTQIALSWYMNQGATGTVPSNPLTALTDLDLEVYNSSGTLVGSSRSRTNNNEIVRFRSATGGSYRVRVVRHTNNNTVERFALAFPNAGSIVTNTVTFNFNHPGAPAAVTRTANAGSALGAENMPTAQRTGFSFAGWNTQANGSGTAFTAVTPVSSNMTVFAQWIEGTVVPISRLRVNSWETSAGDRFAPSNLTDGNPNTYWHARWSQGSGHGRGESFVDLDLGSVQSVSRILVDRRLTSGQNIRAVRMFTHAQTGATFPNGQQIPVDFPANVAQSLIDQDFAMTGWTAVTPQIAGLNTSGTVTLTLNPPVSARYIRLGITNGPVTGDPDFTQVRGILLFAPDNQTPVTTVSVNPTSVNMTVGQNRTSTVTVTNGSGATTVTSGNSAVATATISGNTVTVTGVTAGTTTIEVRNNNVTANIAVTVTGTPQTTVSVNPANLTLAMGMTGTAAVTVTNGQNTTTVTSNNTSVATAALSGNNVTVTPVGVGSTFVTITNNGVEARLNVTVLGEGAAPPVIGTNLPSTLQRTGATAMLSITASSPDGGTITRQWFRVDDNGNEVLIAGETSNLLMTSNTGEHFVRITNTREGMSTTIESTRCFVWTTATGEPPTINISPRIGTVVVGSTLQLTASVHNSAGATTWTSSNPSVATVNASGNVTGITAGTVTITAVNGVRRTTAQVTVSTDEPLIRRGDVNGDGAINAIDVILLQFYLATSNPEAFRIANPTFNPLNADVNNDGVINSADVTLLRRHIANPTAVPLPQ